MARTKEISGSLRKCYKSIRREFGLHQSTIGVHDEGTERPFLSSAGMVDQQGLLGGTTTASQQFIQYHTNKPEGCLKEFLWTD